MLGIVNIECALPGRSEETADGWLAGVMCMATFMIRACSSVM